MNLAAPTITTIGNATTSVTYIGSTWTFPPDDTGLAGVREPRRPLPDPSGASEHAEMPKS